MTTPRVEGTPDSRVGEIEAALRAALGQVTARVAVIAGSGLGGFAAAVKPTATLRYADIPHVGGATVQGHSGTLINGTAGDVPVLVLSGRRHLYEGIPSKDSTLLLRAVLAAFPIDTLIVSNAAGGLNPTFEVADIMLIRDHINWMFQNPLIGPNRDEWGPRFPDVSDCYSRDLAATAKQAAAAAGVVLRQGTYLAVHGPSYETAAEIRMIRHVFAADAVGMSTIPETLIATHMGRRVLGLSVITNLVPSSGPTTHEEVMENSKRAEERFGRLLHALLPML